MYVGMDAHVLYAYIVYAHILQEREVPLGKRILKQKPQFDEYALTPEFAKYNSRQIRTFSSVYTSIAYCKACQCKVSTTDTALYNVQYIVVFNVI